MADLFCCTVTISATTRLGMLDGIFLSSPSSICFYICWPRICHLLFSDCWCSLASPPLWEQSLALSNYTLLIFWPNNTQDYSLLHLPLHVKAMMILKIRQRWLQVFFLVIESQLQLAFTAQVSASWNHGLDYCSLEALPCIYWYWSSSATFSLTYSALCGFPGVLKTCGSAVYPR